MKIKLDENMPVGLVELLQSAGHDAATVSDERLSGASDEALIEACVREQRLLMTFDLDFADIRKYPLKEHGGIVVFRLRDQRWASLKGPARKLIDSGYVDGLAGGLAVVDEAHIRTRAAKG